MSTSSKTQQVTLKVLEEFQQTDFKNEIVPIDVDNYETLLRDPVFWVVTTLGVLPLLITSVHDGNMQLIGMLFFFAMLWGGIFRGLILKSTESITLPVAAFFFTGTIGIFLLMCLYSCFPASYLGMAESNNFIVRLFGFVFQVGLWEELCKIAPVVFYLLYKRKNASPVMILLIGVFSGLGFAAFENIQYSDRSIFHTIEQAVIQGQADGADGAVRGIATGVQAAMVNVMLRSLSLVFAHAVFTAIFSYYIAMAFVSGKRWVVLCFLGLAVPAVLHGVYDWLCGIQPVFAALVIAASFVLFYGYLSKIRQHLAPPTV